MTVNSHGVLPEAGSWLTGTLRRIESRICPPSANACIDARSAKGWRENRRWMETHDIGAALVFVTVPEIFTGVDGSRGTCGVMELTTICAS
ncbi:hypothetical protein Ssi03_27770 [Sphaerisporangium siamense]|nr:hypothetical protein Ssi03_27770 [Sphaerisporangium siamense]